MQLLRNNCHNRANIFVILVAASGSAKDKNKDSAGVLSEIVDCARMRFSSVRNRRSARTVFRPRSFCQNLRAARANPVFRTDEKHIRSENWVMKLLSNNCHIRANVFVILVAAGSRSKLLTPPFP
ncbi:MAG: hypothetical protein A3H27_03510 [Acidobacteria bacterium RIFCSPLOWO2_02_FULL_59_13]|nr:MAG: hypothetical protein A3H27_03510 [Acidobacteria bacterium RIFCSPLOWO2_02_FULL_59_13]